MTDHEPLRDGAPNVVRARSSLTTTTFSLGQTRIVANILIAIGGILFVAWVWSIIRSQQNAGFPYGFGDDGPELTFAQRLDLLTQTLYLLAYASVSLGAGIVVQLMTNLAEPREAVEGV